MDRDMQGIHESKHGPIYRPHMEWGQDCVYDAHGPGFLSDHGIQTAMFVPEFLRA